MKPLQLISSLTLVAASIATLPSAFAQTASLEKASLGSDLIAQADHNETDKVSPRWLSLYGYSAVLPGGNYPWYFNPANLPSNLRLDDVVLTLQHAAGRWSQLCNVNLVYMGLTTTPPLNRVNGGYDRINVVGFIPFSSISANNNYAGLTYVGYDVGSPGEKPHTVIDVDIVLNANAPGGWNLSMLDGAMTHEFGHGLGLDHSQDPGSIMFAMPYHTADYDRVPRKDDVQGCSALYGAAPSQLSNRAMNWAESQYPNELKRLGTAPVTQTYDGYLYRYYPGSNAYVGTKNGRVYYMVGTTKPPQDMGALTDFWGQIDAAGF